MPMLKKKKGETSMQQASRTAMHKVKRGQLHSGSKKGPVVTDPKQALAIEYSEARKGGAKIPKKKAAVKKKR